MNGLMASLLTIRGLSRLSSTRGRFAVDHGRMMLQINAVQKGWDLTQNGNSSTLNFQKACGGTQAPRL